MILEWRLWLIPSDVLFISCSHHWMALYNLMLTPLRTFDRMLKGWWSLCSTHMLCVYHASFSTCMLLVSLIRFLGHASSASDAYLGKHIHEIRRQSFKFTFYAIAFITFISQECYFLRRRVWEICFDCTLFYENAPTCSLMWIRQRVETIWLHESWLCRRRTWCLHQLFKKQEVRNFMVPVFNGAL